MTKDATKTIRCTGCGNPLEVPKWAANKQECELCVARRAKLGPAYEQREQPEEIETSPVDKMKKAQSILGALGFTITARGWHKQFQDGDAMVRIEPYFDTGTSMDAGCALEGFSLIRQEFISVIDSGMSEKLPSVAHQDINTLLQELDIKIPGVALDQTHIDTITCSRCGVKTPEFITLMSSKENLCMAKCAPVRHKFGIS